MSLKQAVCIVTGSATGIGAACAEGLAARGARVVVNYSKSEAEAKEVAASCEAKGGEAIVVQADVSKDADCRKLAKAALDAWGRIDCLINNAGITKFARHSDLDALDALDFTRIYGVNVVGPFQMIRAVTPTMRKQGKGAVVNISSAAGVRGIGSSIAYAASKGALNTMTLSLARALGPEIRVNAVCPGFVETGWQKSALGPNYETARKNYEAGNPLRAVTQPEEVADVAIWLLDGAAKVTGELIMVDGGTHLGSMPVRAR